MGLAGGEERCWEGATVTNVKADRLHMAGVGAGERTTRLAGKSRSSDRWVGMQMILHQSAARKLLPATLLLRDKALTWTEDQNAEATQAAEVKIQSARTPRI